MRIGLIGTGRIGSFHAAALARNQDAGSLLLADADPARAARLADRLGATAAPSVEQVFTWGVDAVVVSCATEGHAELVVRAVRGGLPVFCEKPLATDLGRSLAVLREVSARGGCSRWASCGASTRATGRRGSWSARVRWGGCTPYGR